MNIMMPVDFQSFNPSKEGLGTADARAENSHRNTIEPTQNAAGANQTGQNSESGSDGNHRENNNTKHHKSSDTVNLSEQGKKAAKKDDSEALTEEDKEQVNELEERDREVRVHEQAHAAAGGQYAGSPNYEYETGPDGKRYAVSGEVSIDVSEAESPEDTIAKMQIVRAAALAPAEPSTQDIKVAAEASQKENRARSDVSQQRTAESSDPNDTKTDQKSNRASTSKHAQLYNDVGAYQPHSGFSVSA